APEARKATRERVDPPCQLEAIQRRSRPMRATLVLAGLVSSSVLGAVVVSCATSDSVNSTQGSGSGGGQGSSSSGLGGSILSGSSSATASSSSSSTTTASSSSGSGGGSGSSSSSSGPDAGDGGPDCTNGCMPGYIDLDKNPATGVCGCEY